MKLCVLAAATLFIASVSANAYQQNGNYGAPVGANPYLLHEYQDTYVVPQGGYATAPAPKYGTAPGYGTAPAPVPNYGVTPEYGTVPAPVPNYGVDPAYGTTPAPAPNYGYNPAPAPDYGTAPAPGYGASPVPQPYMDPAAELSYYGNLCDVDYAPHSYACHHWNYLGNSTFPLFTMDWWSLQGEWFATTYANPTSENIGPEFQMLKNPNRPTQPMGVINNYSRQHVGSVWVTSNSMVWTNWLGQVLETDANSFRQLDAHTVEMYAYGYQQSHYFQCRDFNRNGGHHILCRWDVLDTQSQRWVAQGYFGFMPKSLWDSFSRAVRN